MEVVYTRHARRRMSERGIGEAEVEAALALPVAIHRDRDGNAVSIGHLGGRRIRVVLAADSSPARVITVGD